MLPDIAILLVYVAVALSILAGLAGLLGLKPLYVRGCAVGLGACIGAALLILMISFAVSDFSVLLVANYSHTTKPLIYKLSATWGNHEGSILLWIFILAAFNAVYAMFCDSSKFSTYLISVQSLIILLFLVYMNEVSSPFVRLFPAPTNGYGLNPLLQDIGLAMHPPVLYLGYVGFSIAYSSACAALLSRVDIKTWARITYPYVLASWIFLTAGIALGSWWAYRELGWGGFWFWDPVENASLIPWLSATALMHTLIVVKRTQVLQSWSIMLALATFAFSVVGTFLVRSGAVTSVHSFATDPTRGVAILMIVAVLSVFATCLYAARFNYRHKIPKQISRSRYIGYNNIAFIFFTIVVAVGTIYPVIYGVVFGENLSIGYPFYNQFLKPTVVVLMVLCMVAPSSSYIGGHFEWRKLITVSFTFSMLLTLGICHYFEIVDPIMFIIIALGFWVLTESARYTKRWSSAGMALAHMGFGLAVVAVTITSSATKELEVLVNKGDSIKVAGFNITLRHVEHARGPNYLTRIATFDVYENRKFITTQHPELRLYPVEGQFVSDTSIYVYPFYDLYFAIGEGGEDGKVLTRIYYKPFMSMLWLAALLAALGGAISFTRFIWRATHAKRT